ncbi:hypothetical protein [Corynebacterium pseudopelargi]|uniref:hypothetical protein n=1 Tax=Corynebacterium pseudopelargi TaxID=2080757 RepID=UPI000F4F6313|nr:hypothetical protein [Corynebacterium pseudopelargi]
MKLSKTLAATAALSMALTMAACSNDDDKEAESSSSSTSSSKAAAQAEMPTAADLNAIVAVATDPNAPIEEKQQTVQGSNVDPALFEVLTRSKQESGAEFIVVDPVLPGYAPNSVLATVNVNIPEQEPQTADNVEFIFEDGRWKLSQDWACTLLKNSVPADQVPPMCIDEPAPPAPVEGEAPAPEAPAADAPAPEAPPADAPAPEAPAPEAPAPEAQ